MRTMANRLMFFSMLVSVLFMASPARAASGKPAVFVDMVQAFIELFTGPSVGERVSALAQNGPHNASDDGAVEEKPPAGL